MRRLCRRIICRWGEEEFLKLVKERLETFQTAADKQQERTS